ncbi:ATP-dependent DNA ligase [Tuberibacillus sp. Marseille-P3662]|uniref:ATP-dependent DNA ligase n=1 Tax=Tuberibacillus sp. Marseille-P3662 TaxID=1965358 RepID=UPI000A1CE7AA|nr:RNA ligase family protein [Tuberibacillus sp. Marseille-P3662]
MNLQPIVPFEPIRMDQAPNGESLIAQVKWDGVRVLTYYDGETVNLFNRKQNNRTEQFPELIEIQNYCDASSVILDGEVIALGTDGQPSFHEVMRRDGIRNIEKVEQRRQEIPISYMIFDMIYYNGEWIDQWPLQERMELLKKVIIPSNTIQVVPSHSDSDTLFSVVKKHQLEGIVVKDVTRAYQIKGKDDRWVKVKNYRDLTAVVGGVTKRSGIVNALLLGLYDHTGGLHYIGHTGTGKLTAHDWRDLTERVEPLITKIKPFVNQPERSQDAIWLEPQLTVKVNFIEWPEGRTLRQPSIQAFVDQSPEDCTL